MIRYNKTLGNRRLTEFQETKELVMGYYAQKWEKIPENKKKEGFDTKLKEGE